MTLGRHSNDYMTSFYIHSPSHFFVEYGWSGRAIDTALGRAVPPQHLAGPTLGDPQPAKDMVDALEAT